MTTETSHPSVDPRGPGLFGRPDVFDAVAALRRDAPAFHVGGDVWVVTRYQDVLEISRDPVRFISRRGVLMNDPLRASAGEADPTYSILHLDPPLHVRYRTLINKRFTPRAVAGLEPAIRAEVVRVLDAVESGSTIDAVAEIAAPIPITVITHLLGIEDVNADDFRRWSDAAIASSDGATEQQLMDLGELANFLLAHVDRPASSSGDMLDTLKGASIDGEHPLSRAEIMSFCITLLVAGNETTRTLISGALDVLASHPGQRAALAADPAGIPTAVEEILRWVTPIQAFARTAVVDVEIGEIEVPAGSYVVMLYASANRDETVFGPTANRFDAARPIDPAHLAFGFGEHRCLGAALARLEAKVVLEELLARFPAYDVVGPPEFTESTLARGHRSLPVVLAPTAGSR